MNKSFRFKHLVELWQTFEADFLEPLRHHFNAEDEAELIEPLRQALTGGNTTLEVEKIIDGGIVEEIVFNQGGWLRPLRINTSYYVIIVAKVVTK